MTSQCQLASAGFWLQPDFLMNDCYSICCSQLFFNVQKACPLLWLNPCRHLKGSIWEVLCQTAVPLLMASTVFTFIKVSANDTRSLHNNPIQYYTHHRPVCYESVFCCLCGQIAAVYLLCVLSVVLDFTIWCDHLWRQIQQN